MKLISLIFNFCSFEQSILIALGKIWASTCFSVAEKHAINKYQLFCTMCKIEMYHPYNLIYTSFHFVHLPYQFYFLLTRVRIASKLNAPMNDQVGAYLSCYIVHILDQDMRCTYF